MNLGNITEAVAKVFFAPPEQQELSLLDIRQKINAATFSMQESARQAEVSEKNAREALQKTFAPGVSPMERARLRTEHQRQLELAKMHMSCASQAGSLLETLETSETFLELSSVISESGVPGAEKLDIGSLMKELQAAQANLSVLCDECQRMKSNLDNTISQMIVPLGTETTQGMSKLNELYDQYDKETDPVKKAAIRAKIEAESATSLSVEG